MRTTSLSPQSNWTTSVPGLQTFFLFGLVGIALLLGTVVALFGGFIALIVFVVLTCSVMTLWDYRIGLLFIVLFYPLSGSYFFPTMVFGIIGANPLNLLFLLTLASFGVSRLFLKGQIWILPNTLLVLFILTILFAGFHGTFHIKEAPVGFLLQQDFSAVRSTTAYLTQMVIKPMQLVFSAWLLAHAIAESRSPDRYAYFVPLSILPLAALVIIIFAISGSALSEISSRSAREFFNVIGYHANTLGFMLSMAFALLLFIQNEIKHAPVVRACLNLALGVVVIALILTFSRGAFLLAFIALLAFLGSKMKSASSGWPFILTALVLAALPDEVWWRLSEGLGESISFASREDRVSAGRVWIWLALLPDVLESPIWGHGIGSIMWSDAMKSGGALSLIIHPHSAYVTSILDTGVVGLLITLGFHFWVWREFRQMSKCAELSPALRGFFAGGAAGLLGFSVAAITNSSFYPWFELILLWFAIGFLFGVKRRLGSTRQ